MKVILRLSQLKTFLGKENVRNQYEGNNTPIVRTQWVELATPQSKKNTNNIYTNNIYTYTYMISNRFPLLFN